MLATLNALTAMGTVHAVREMPGVTITGSLHRLNRRLDLPRSAKRTAAVLRPARRVGCTKDTTRCDFWNWGSASVRPPCCTEHFKEMLSYIHELLERNDITHWLDYGTLLGAVREQAFIAWDEDVDLGVFDEDAEAILALEPEIAAAGYRVDTTDPGAIQINYSPVNEAPLDLFRWKEQDDWLGCDFDPDYEWPGLHQRTSFPRRYVERLGTVTLYGRPYPAPAPVDRFLVEHRYGPDYMIPTRPIMSVWLYPELGPHDMTPAVKRMLGSIAEKDRHLAELNYRSRLSRTRAWRAWRDAALPLAPPPQYLRRARDGIPAGERTEVIGRLVYSIASLEHAIDELERPGFVGPLRRTRRRTVRAKEAIVGKLRGRPRKGGFPFRPV
jgi:LicD family